MRIVATLLCCVFFLFSFSRNYYLSAAGKDIWSGQSPQQPFRTISRLQKVILRAGDTVFFKREEIFQGTLTIKWSGTASRPIVIAAYGEGAPPVLTGARPVAQWKEVAPTVFETGITQPVYDVFHNNQRLTPARYPNHGFMLIEKGHGKDSITSSFLKEPDGYWNGATLRVRTIDWVYETRTVKEYQKGLIIQGKQYRYAVDRSFFERTKNNETPLYPFQKGYGFYLEGLPEMVDTAGEWSCHKGKLRLQTNDKTESNNLIIDAVVQLYGIWLQPNVQHIIIDGIQFRHYEKAGVGAAPNVASITIANNAFQQIHGAGVLLDSASTGCVIRNNRFTDILGRGISALEPERLEVDGNTLLRIGLSKGHGWSSVNGASGIILYNVERKVQSDTTYAHHNTVRKNRVDSCGYNGIRVDGHHNLVENNVIDHCSLTLNDGANLYCFAAGPGVTHHSIFRNNIVRYSIGNSDATPNNPNLAFGIYIDNNSHDMIVEGNTIVATGAAGIVNNDASFRNIFRNNLVYDCKDGIGFAEWGNLGKVFDCTIEGNTVIAFKPEQKLLNLSNFIGPQFQVGQFSNNRYIHPTATASFFFQTKQVPQHARLDLTFGQWQAISGSDRESKAVTAGTDWIKDKVPHLLINDSGTTTTRTTDNEWWSVDGNKLSGTLSLKPFSSVVVWKKKGEGTK